MEASISANRDEAGPLGVIVAFRDITERRKAELQARQLQKMDALALMATGLGRELAESQNKMDDSLRILIEDSASPTPRLLWDVYERSAQQQSVVQQLISLGKSSKSEAELLDLNSVLSGLEERMQKTLGVRRQLKLKLQIVVPRIHANSSQLRENLLRLIADVREATAEGGLVEVSTETVALGGGKNGAQITIRDNRKVSAIGSSERFFDPYYQSRPGKRNSGFSLALVYQFAALIGATIDVETSPGVGFAYFLRFPAAHSQLPPSPDGMKITKLRQDVDCVAAAV